MISHCLVSYLYQLSGPVLPCVVLGPSPPLTLTPCIRYSLEAHKLLGNGGQSALFLIMSVLHMYIIYTTLAHIKHSFVQQHEVAQLSIAA